MQGYAVNARVTPAGEHNERSRVRHECHGWLLLAGCQAPLYPVLCR